MEILTTRINGSFKNPIILLWTQILEIAHWRKTSPMRWTIGNPKTLLPKAVIMRIEATHFKLHHCDVTVNKGFPMGDCFCRTVGDNSMILNTTRFEKMLPNLKFVYWLIFVSKRIGFKSDSEPIVTFIYDVTITCALPSHVHRTNTTMWERLLHIFTPRWMGGKSGSIATACGKLK